MAAQETAPATAKRASMTTKVVVIIFLVLILIVPALLILGLVQERERTRNEAVDEVSSKWGGPQTITGPILTIPYRAYDLDTAGRRTNMRVEIVHVLPARLEVNATMNPEVRHRGIYSAVLYTAATAMRGQFGRDDLAALGVDPKDVIWNAAYVSVGIPDMRGVRDAITLSWDGKEFPFKPGVPQQALIASGVTARLDSSVIGGDVRDHEFALRLNLNGSGVLNFLPLGRQTEATVRSSWPSPSFGGAFLPAQRTISSDGFSARWKVLDLNRNYPQVIHGNADLAASAFGTKLLVPVDNYQQTTRSVKYAALFIVLTFLAFFLLEVIRDLRVHPVQYLLVGSALVLFYLLLLSLSEYVAFGSAYLIAAAATVLLVVAYVGSVFRRVSLALVIGAILVVLYGYLYVLLQLEDYSLLLGAAGLFAILAAVMFLTRKMDWYAMEFKKPAEAVEAPTAAADETAA